MPGTPTTPDNLPIILDTDSPDIPRDMNALANATQAALEVIRNMSAIDNDPRPFKFAAFNMPLTTDASGNTLGVDLSVGGKYGQIAWMWPTPYATLQPVHVTVTDATANSVNFYFSVPGGAPFVNQTIAVAILILAI